MKKLILLFLSLLCACASSSSTSSSVPPVPVFGDIRLRVTATDSSTAAASLSRNLVSLQEGSLNIDEIRMVLSEISFKPQDGIDNETEFPDTYISTLVFEGTNNTSTYPSLEDISLAAGNYREIEFKISKFENSSLPSELLDDPLSNLYLNDNSLVITGTYEGSTQIPFRIISDNDFNIRLRASNNFNPQSTSLRVYFVVFRLQDWTQNLPALFSNLQESDLQSGSAIITDSSNSRLRAILDQLENNISGSCKAAPSADDTFEESDIDEDSSSESF